VKEGPAVIRSKICRKKATTQTIIKVLTAGVHPPIPKPENDER